MVYKTSQKGTLLVGNGGVKTLYIAFILSFLIFILFSPSVSAETVKLLENTDVCYFKPEIYQDFCYTKYEICDSPLTSVQDSTFLFKDDKNGYTDKLDSVFSNTVTIKDKGNCKVLTITAYKSPFRNVDNVLCTQNRCYYEYAWWNRSFPIKYPVNASTTLGSVTLPILLNDTATIINNTPQYIWCNYTVNTTRSVVGYLYVLNETTYACVNRAEDARVSMFIDEGNETSFGIMDGVVAAWGLGRTGVMSVNGCDLTNSGTVEVIEGQVGKAFKYDADDFSNTSCDGLKNMDEDLSVSFWINDSSHDVAYETPLAKGPFGNGHWSFRKHTIGDDAIYFDVINMNSVNTVIEVNDEQWHMVTGTWDNSTNNVSIYLDGVLKGTTTTGTNAMQAYAFDTCIGGRDCTGTIDRKWDGEIDNVFIYNRTLLPEEVMALYNNTEGTHNFAPLGSAIELDQNTSILAINRELSDFVLNDPDFVDASIINFNTTSANTTFLILSSMNIEKLVPGGTNIITVRLILDSDETLIEEDLRTVTGISDVGSTGTSPIIFSVASGEHNITYQFRRTGPGSINITNFDFNMIQFVSFDGNDIRNDLVNTDFNHTNTTFITAFNWTMNKTLNSSTFIIVKNTISKTGTDSTIASYRFENLLTGDTSPFWQRFLSDSSDIGSISGIYIDPEEIGDHNHSISSRQTDTGDVVLVNGSLVDFDLIDSDSRDIPFFQLSNESTNLTDSLTLGSGIHLLAESTVPDIIGNSYFIAFFSSFSSTTGSQTPRYFIDSPNLTTEQCFTQKRRTLSSNDDIGNAFAYTICEGLTMSDIFTFRLWVEIESGESLTQLDESFAGFETTNFSISEGELAPIASAITNPINGSNVSGSDVITWLPFFDPNDDLVTYNITLINFNGTHNATIGLTNSTSFPVNWDLFSPGSLFIRVEGCDPGGLCDNINNTITIIAAPIPDLRPSIIFCEDNDILRTEVNERTTTNGNITDEFVLTRSVCQYGCSNITISNWGNSGCIESDLTLSLVLIAVVLISVFTIRRVI